MVAARCHLGFARDRRHRNRGANSRAVDAAVVTRHDAGVDQLAMEQQAEPVDVGLLRDYPVVEQLDLLENYDVIEHLDQLPAEHHHDTRS